MVLMKNNRVALRGKDIRKGNEKLVLRLIQKENLLSQSEAVELTGLKAPTLLRIFTNLEEAGLIEISEIPKETSEKKGRKPVYYRLNSGARYVVGVEFWAFSATVVISNFVREPVYSTSVKIDRNLDGEAVLKILHKLIEDSLVKAKIKKEKIAGIGIGAPGKVNIKDGSVIFYSRINGLHNLPVANFLEKKLDLPVSVHNNCSVIAMNEYNGEQKSEPLNIMAVLIRGGVGGAYINNGKVMTSGNITAMEIGHMSVDPKGRKCSCGFQGCLETYLSEDAILNDLAAGSEAPDINTLDKLIPDMSGDSITKKVLDQKAEVLSYALRNLSHLFSPDLFIIISRSIELSRYLSEKSCNILEVADDQNDCNGFRIKPVCYNPLHAGMGACDLVFHDYFYDGN